MQRLHNVYQGTVFRRAGERHLWQYKHALGFDLVWIYFASSQHWGLDEDPADVGYNEFAQADKPLGLHSCYDE